MVRSGRRPLRWMEDALVGLDNIMEGASPGSFIAESSRRAILCRRHPFRTGEVEVRVYGPPNWPFHLLPAWKCCSFGFGVVVARIALPDTHVDWRHLARD